MEYHGERFKDFSLMIFKKDQLVGLMPANKVGDHIFSHQGLTFGGLILPMNTAMDDVCKILDEVVKYLKGTKIKSLTIKRVPEFYCKQPAQEEAYYFFKNLAKSVSNHMVLAIDYHQPLTIHKTKLKHYRNTKYGFEIKEANGFEPFWNLVLIPRLKQKHQAKPVHTLEEIEFLASKFPKNIKQFNIYVDTEMVAGITIFENETVVKSQYGATTKLGEKTRALDYLFLHLIFKYQKEGKHYFSMGTVTEGNELGYNPGLLKQKEELGCKVYVQNVLKLSFI